MIHTMQPGAPCWLDLGSPDVAASASFYEGVFGWRWEPAGGAELADFGLLRLAGQTVGGIGALGDGVRSAWLLYFRTPDSAETVRAARELGATARVEPFEPVGGEPMAQLTDPQGAEFAVWQATSPQHLVTVSEPGALLWCELYTPDAAPAKEFYRALFGWGISDMSMAAEDSPGYSVVAPEGGGPDEGQGGIMEMEEAGPGSRAHWQPVFRVTDCDAAVASVADGGGIVQMGPDDVPGVGRLAACADPFGATFVVLRPRID